MISFDSEVTKKILSIYYLNEDNAYYLNELAEKLQIDKRNMSKKLKELEKEGLFISEKQGNQRYFSLNRKFPLYQEYKNIFEKTAGLEHKLKEIMSSIPGIEKAFIFGSYAKNTMNTGSDIDILAVGSHSVIQLQKKLSALQKISEREFNAVSFSAEEFSSRKKTDSFVKRILKDPLISLV